ncbi:mitochondrial enolase superfamily member 1 [Grus japonensis]|uniref:Mitochondrial enolase superfamily member 1 n=1 Tax=Grus japonensis TaxID=30415 RepID=A0ABC9VYF4_GRUJA
MIDRGHWEKWRKVNATPIFKKGKKGKNPGNYRPVSLTSVPGKVLEKLIMKTIFRHMNNKKAIRSSQHGFTKGKLTNLNLYDETTCLINKERARDIVYLDFSKAFNTVSHMILIKKLMKYGLDEQTVRWTENYLNSWPRWW